MDQHSTGDASECHSLTPNWTRVITPKRSLLSLPLGEVWDYRDLLFLLVRRDFVSLYTQTILGPLWFVIQPLLTTLMFTVVFGGIANISTDGIPRTAFYLAGVTMWTFFADSLSKTSETFTANTNIFGKVYFPRMIVPLSVVASNLIKFGVQFVIFAVFVSWYLVSGEAVKPNGAILVLPFLLLLMAMLALGLGMTISALTTKYRDLRFLLTFAVQLMMYATPVIYPASALPRRYALLIQANPITPIIETFRYAFLGRGQFSAVSLGYSFAVSVVVLAIGMVTFNQVEKTFADTV